MKHRTRMMAAALAVSSAVAVSPVAGAYTLGEMADAYRIPGVSSIPYVKDIPFPHIPFVGFGMTDATKPGADRNLPPAMPVEDGTHPGAIGVYRGAVVKQAFVDALSDKLADHITQEQINDPKLDFVLFNDQRGPQLKELNGQKWIEVGLLY